MSKINVNIGLEFLQKSFIPRASPLRVCFTSRSTAGAWQIRGQQIAAMRSNWVATSQPSDEDIEQADLICLVKKPETRVIERARQLRKPLVFDIIDSWAQPKDGLKCNNTHEARELFQPVWQEINADGYIFPTWRMQEDLGALVKNKVTIYHHYWPQIQKSKIRNRVEVIGYEGADYLGEWRSRIERACRERDIRFIANPINYADLDIVIMARGGVHGNFLSWRYKSNVKLANAMGSGTPALVHFEEMSAHDTDSGDVMFFTDQPGSFERQLDRLVNDHALRVHIHKKFISLAPRFNIQNIVEQFEGFFLRIFENQRNNNERVI